jgi:hypothetical protein
MQCPQCKWMTINNYTAFNGGYLLKPLDLFKRLCKNLLSLCLTLHTFVRMGAGKVNKDTFVLIANANF